MFYYSTPATEPHVDAPPAAWRFDLADRQAAPWWRERLGQHLLMLSLAFHDLYFQTNQMAKRVVAAPKLRTGTGHRPLEK
jgi:hypothetical protein